MLAFMLLFDLASAGDQVNSAVPYQGDGQTPTYDKHLAMTSSKGSTAHHLAQGDAKGGGGWSTSIEMPPALISTDVSVSWSLGAPDSGLGPGWTLNVGPSLRRPSNAELAGAYGEGPEVMIVQGGGVDGLLVQEPNIPNWVWVSDGAPDGRAFETTPPFVPAWPAVTTWSLQAAGRIVGFSPRLESLEWGTPAPDFHCPGVTGTCTLEPRTFKPMLMTDVSQNAVSWTWSGPFITRIDTGANLQDNSLYPATGRVLFEWSTRDAVDGDIQFRHDEGVEERIDKRLDRIVVLTSKVDASGWVEKASWKFTYDDHDGSKVLSRIEHFGSNGLTGTPRLVGEFEYSTWAGGYDQEDSAPNILSRSFTRNSFVTCLDDEDGQKSETFTLAKFVDVNFDGNLDLLTRADDPAAQREALRFGADHTMDGATVPLPGAFGGVDASVIDHTVTTPVGYRTTVSVAQVKTLDLNGDGILDTVYAAPVPELLGECGPNAQVLTVSGDHTFAPGEYAWQVAYGGQVSTTQELAPLPWPEVSRQRSRCEQEQDNWPAWTFGREHYTGQEVSLEDLTGDGWLDLVYFQRDVQSWSHQHQPDSVLLIPKIPQIGAGFGEPVVLATRTGTGSLDQAMLAPWTEATYGGEWWGDAITGSNGSAPPWAVEAPPDVWQVCPVDQIRVLRGFTDLTGDGLVDFIAVAESRLPGNASLGWHATAAANGFDVYAGNGHGFEPEPIRFGVPDSNIQLGLNRSREIVDVVTNPTTPLDPQYEPDCNSVDMAPAVMQQGDGDQPCGNSVFGCASFPQSVAATCENSVPRDGFGVTHSRSTVELELLDVDGDARLDLIESQAALSEASLSPLSGGSSGRLRWWRNTGAGFSVEQCGESPFQQNDGCPEFQYLRRGLQRSATLYAGGPYGFTTRFDEKVVQDINGDGTLDAVIRNVVSVDPVDPNGKIRYGTGLPSLVLTNVATNGVESRLQWSPASANFPQGYLSIPDVEAQSNKRGLTIRAVTTEDLVSGSAERSEWTFTHGVSAAREWRGYASVRKEDLTFDHTLVAGRFAVGASGIGGFAEDRFWQRTTSTVTAYALSRDRSLAVAQTVNFDPGLHHETSIGGVLGSVIPSTGQPSLVMKALTTHTYQDVSGQSDCFDPGASETHLPRCRAVESKQAEFAEVSQGEQQVSVVETDWSPTGELVAVRRRDGEAVLSELQIDWTTDEGGWIHVPVVEELYEGYAAQGQLLHRMSREYDATGGGAPPTRGLLTAQSIDTESGEVLRWDFLRHPRGQVQQIYSPLGAGKREETTVFRFGGTVPGITVNVLGHESRAFVDDYGRVSRTRDPNGVVRRTTFDEFGRPLTETVQGAEGVEVRVKDFSYSAPQASPQWTYAREWLDASNLTPVAGTNKAVETYEIHDGAGQIRQRWRRSPTGDWIVSDEYHDLRGQKRWTTDAVRRAQFSTDLAATSSSVLLSKHAWDGLGRERATWDDLIQSPACLSQNWVTDAGAVVSVDENGFTKTLQSDAAGRLVKVLEGRTLLNSPSFLGVPSVGASGACNSAFTPPAIDPGTHKAMASYAWNGADRLAQIWDGSTEAGAADAYANSWRYHHDRAGRQHTVERSINGGPWTPYYAFEYDDGVPIRMWEGEARSDGTYEVQWAYDDLGRATTKQIRTEDATSQNWVVDTYTWRYDCLRSDSDPPEGSCYNQPHSRFWRGALLETQAPAAKTEYFFGVVTPGAGKLGFEGRRVRTFTDADGHAVDANGNPIPVTFEFERDLRGQVTGTKWPSGRWVRNAYNTNGWVATEQIKNGSSVVDTATLAYNARGELSGSWMTSGFSNSYVRHSPGVLTSVTWSRPTGSALTQTWSHLANGFPTKAAANFAIAGQIEGIGYRYDGLGRVVQVDRLDSQGVPTATPWEAWEYDRVGNLLRGGPVTGGQVSTYGVAEYNMPAGKLFGTAHEDYGYSGASRRTSTTQYDTANPTQVSTWLYAYEGTGQLARTMWVDQSPGGVIRRQSWLDHDIDDSPLTQVDTTYSATGAATLTYKQFWFDGWNKEVRKPVGAAVVTKSREQWTSWVEAEVPTSGAATRRYLFAEPDGHALVVMDSTGTILNAEQLGAYGRWVRRTNTLGDDPTESNPISGREEHQFHGMAFDRSNGLTRMGVRHLSFGDGQWLQPEPMIAFGLVKSQLLDPRSSYGTYAGGSPTWSDDRSGYIAPAVVIMFVAKEVGTEFAGNFLLSEVAAVSPLGATMLEAAMMGTSPLRAAKGASKVAIRQAMRVVKATYKQTIFQATEKAWGKSLRRFAAPSGAGELQGMANEIRTAANHPAAANMRTIAVGKEGDRLFCTGCPAMDAGQRAKATDMGIEIINPEKGLHAEQTLLNNRPGMTDIGTSKRAPCGSGEQNCAGRLKAAGVRVDNQ